MGLVDVVLLTLCANISCPGDPVIDISHEKKLILENQSKHLRNKTLKIATLYNPPLSSFYVENGTIIGDGIAFEYIHILQEKIGFKYEVVIPAEESLDVTQNGIIGMLNRNEVDLAAAFLPVFPNFWKYIRYSRSLDKGEWVVLMKRPPVSATGSGLLAPFTFQVWLLILVSLFLVGPIIYGIILLQAHLCKDDETKVYPLPACVWFVYGALLKQGSTLSPMTDSSRILFSTWWIFITILTAFYTANLTAFLTLSKFTLPINKLSDIGDKKYSWVTHKGNAIEEAALNDPVFKAGIRGSRNEYLVENATNILENWVKRNNYMYIGEKPIVEHLMYRDYLSRNFPNMTEADRCTYVITTWTITDTLRAFGYSLNFEFADLFNNILEHLVESGIVKYTLSSGLPDTQICPLDLGSKERKLQNTDLLMTYYIVVGGFVISTIVFTGEQVYFKCIHKGKLDKNPEKLFTTINKKLTTLGNENQNQFSPPPPPYHALFTPPFPHTPKAQTKTINGREYWVVRNIDGATTLIPIRTPSAFLFQYTH
ncbi:glutamate receptor ionotropic, delta-1 [Onthophagus taurus]|uniref:glutamate receptor ionotropic, delta-1 n=1 Tax=Onthophagus taurus TaxID=166361 RepID=UPI000C20D7BF|nr:glutamate receptor ionotropic, delta-1 [Onthophagus taurus]